MSMPLLTLLLKTVRRIEVRRSRIRESLTPLACRYLKTFTSAASRSL
jgi:hypothetical protein